MEPRGVLLARGPEALQNETDEHNPGSLQKDELAMVASDLGRLEQRHTEIVSSLIRFELKRLLNVGAAAVALCADTGNLQQNYEDPAGPFVRLSVRWRQLVDALPR